MPYRASELRPPAAPRRAAARWLPAVAALAVFVGGYFGLASRHASTRRPPPGPTPAVACESVQVLATRADGVRDILCGPVRETLQRRGDPVVAAQSFAAPVVTAAPVARGWVFVTADGAITRSDTFAGSLHLLGRVPCFDSRAATPRSVGRIAVLDRNGALWTTDGAFATRWTFPARVRSVVFADAAHGAVVLDHGELLETRDAGRTWPRVDLQHDVAWAVVLTPSGIVAATTAGTQRLGPDGPRRVGVHLDDEQVREAISFPMASDDRAVRASVRAMEIFRVAVVDDRCMPVGPEVSTAEFEAPFETAETPSYRCHISERRREGVRTTARRPPEAPPESAAEAAILTGSGDVDANLWRASDGHVRLHLAWSGRDAEGPFGGHAGPETEGIPARPSVPSESWSGSAVLVDAISRRGLLLSNDDLGTGLLWAGSGRPVLALGRPSAEQLGAAIPQRTSMAETDGAVALLQWAYGPSHTLAAALAVGPDGAVRQHRGLVADPSYLVALGRWGSALGIVLWRPGGLAPEWFHPLDGGAPRRLPRLPLIIPRACATAAPVGDPDAITLWCRRLDLAFEPATPEDGLMESPGFASATRYELEWARGQMCVRAVTLNRGGMGAEGFGGVSMTLQARPGDRFEGSLADAGAARVTCRGR